MEFPITIRMPYGGGVRAPELHDDSPEAYYVHTPGVKVAIPSTPADAKGLLAAAIRDPDPVVDLRAEAPLPDDARRGARRRARRPARPGARRARGVRRHARRLRGDGAAGRAGGGRAWPARRAIEVLDLRTLKPLDEDALLASAAKTGRVVVVQEAPRTCGYAAEIAAILAEKAILDLRGPVLARDRLRRPLPVLEARGRVHAVGGARRRRRAEAAGVLMAVHEIPLERRTLHGHFSRDLEPVLTIDSGRLDRVRDARRGLGPRAAEAGRRPRGGSSSRATPSWTRGHALDRADRGARRAAPGRRSPCGSTRPRRHVRVHASAAASPRRLTTGSGSPRARAACSSTSSTRTRARRGDRQGRELDLRPFLGVMGMPPPEPGSAPDRAAADLGREHRLQGARRRDDALPADPGRRRALLGRRLPRAAGRRRGFAASDRVPGRARRS